MEPHKCKVCGSPHWGAEHVWPTQRSVEITVTDDLLPGEKFNPAAVKPAVKMPPAPPAVLKALRKAISEPSTRLRAEKGTVTPEQKREQARARQAARRAKAKESVDA